MVGAEIIPEPIWALGNVWPKLPIKFSFPSSCLCLASTVLKLVLSQNLKDMQILGLNLSFFPLSFCTPCSLILCAANSNCFSLSWLCSLSPHLCKRPSGYLVFSSLPCHLEILSRKKAGVIIGLPLFVSLSQGSHPCISCCPIF